MFTKCHYYVFVSIERESEIVASFEEGCSLSTAVQEQGYQRQVSLSDRANLRIEIDTTHNGNFQRCVSLSNQYVSNSYDKPSHNVSHTNNSRYNIDNSTCSKEISRVAQKDQDNMDNKTKGNYKGN